MGNDGKYDWLRAYARDRNRSALPDIEVISSTFECFKRQLTTRLCGDDAEIARLILQFLPDAPDCIRNTLQLRRWILGAWPDTSSTDLSTLMFFGRSNLHKKRGSINGAGSKRNRREMVEGNELVGPIKGCTCESGRGCFLALSAPPGSRKPHTYKCDRCHDCPKRHFHRTVLKQEGGADGDWALYQIGPLQLPPTIPHSLVGGYSSPPTSTATSHASSDPPPTSVPTPTPAPSLHAAIPPSRAAPPLPSPEVLAPSPTPQLGYPHPSSHPLHPVPDLPTAIFPLPYPPSTPFTPDPSDSPTPATLHFPSDPQHLPLPPAGAWTHYAPPSAQHPQALASSEASSDQDATTPMPTMPTSPFQEACPTVACPPLATQHSAAWCPALEAQHSAAWCPPLEAQHSTARCPPLEAQHSAAWCPSLQAQGLTDQHGIFQEHAPGSHLSTDPQAQQAYSQLLNPEPLSSSSVLEWQQAASPQLPHPQAQHPGGCTKFLTDDSLTFLAGVLAEEQGAQPLASFASSGDTSGDTDTLDLGFWPGAIDRDLALNDGVGLAAGDADGGGLEGLLSCFDGGGAAGWDDLLSDDVNDRQGARC